MRATSFAVVLFLFGLFGLLAVPACTEEKSGMVAENVLELHLGGDYPSLREALQQPPPGVSGKPARKPTKPQPKQTTPRISDGPPGNSRGSRPAQPIPTPTPKVDPTPRPNPPKKPEFHVVTIGEGQTLFGLCRAQLGNGGRWKEVARLNGWTEAQAGNLRAGQRVKLPIR